MVFDESWESFLEWSDGKGLPFRGFNDAFEERGIPFLPAALALILLSATAIYFSPSLFGPGTATLTVKALSNEGIALEGVEVGVETAGGERFSGVTDSRGRASFEGVPAGKASVSVSSLDYVFGKEAFQQVELDSGVVSLSVKGELLFSDAVSLYVEVGGVEEASVYLLDSDGEELDYSYALAGSASFKVSPNKDYLVEASSPGYSSSQKTVSVGESDFGPVTLDLAPLEEAGQAKLSVRVVDEAGRAVANASVTLADPVTGKQSYSFVSSEDGSTGEAVFERGSNVSVRVIAEGFKEFEEVVSLSQAKTVFEAGLVPPLGSAAELRVRVLDSSGNLVQGPSVTLYSSNKAALASYAPVLGVAEFNVSRGSQYFVSAFKPGYLPAFTPVSGLEADVVLEEAGEENSGSVRVRVLNPEGVEVPGALCSFESGGNPVGVVPRETLADGTQLFEGLPLVELVAVAVDGPRVARSPPLTLLPGEEAEVVLEMPLLEVSQRVSVRDYYSGSVIPGASVSFTPEEGGQASCSTNAGGSCLLSVTEGVSSVAVEAEGFEGLSAEHSVAPGIEEAVFELVSEEVAAPRLAFRGLYSLDGEEVVSVDPYTTYNAKYVFTAPPGVEFSRATAHVRLGELTGVQGSDQSAITGFSAEGASIGYGSDYDESVYSEQAPSSAQVSISSDGVLPRETLVSEGGAVSFENDGSEQVAISVNGEFDSASIAPGSSFEYSFESEGDYSLLVGGEAAATIRVAAPVQQGAPADSSNELKWVEFRFGSFEGSRELLVQVRTSKPSQNGLSLYQRSAFYTGKGVLRDPEDGEAGETKEEELANVKPSASFDSDFEGTCALDEDVCVTAFFSGGRSSRNGFETEIGEPVKMFFEVFSSPSRPLEFSASTATPALSFDGPSTQSFSTDASGHYAGSLDLLPRRLSEDAAVSYFVSSGNSELFTGSASMRVTAESAPLPFVSLSHSPVTALEEETLVFEVADDFGSPVEGASITLSAFTGKELASPLQATEEGAGVYSASFQALGAGTLSYEVRAAGFKARKGRIQVNAPQNFLEASPSALRAAVSGAEGTMEAFTLTNPLSNDLRVTASVYTTGSPEYTGFDVFSSSFVLPAGESLENAFYAFPRQGLLLVGNQADSYKEEVSGAVRLRARVGSETRTVEVPFQARTNLIVKSLGESWEVSTSSLDYSFDPEIESSQVQTLTVTNNAPHPLLVNQESSLRGVFVSPVSAVLESGESIDFQVEASSRSLLVDGCMTGDESYGALSLYGSVQGVRSLKEVDLYADLSSAAPCTPRNGYTVSLPLDAEIILLPGGYKEKTNSDGSLSIQPPGGPVFNAQSGQLKGGALAVPLQTDLVLPPEWVSHSNNDWTFTLPFEFRLYLSDESAAQQPGGSLKLEAYDGSFEFGAGSRVANVQGGRAILVPAGAPIRFSRTDCNSLMSSLPANAVNVVLPVQSTLYLLSGSSVSDESNSNCPAPPSYYPQGLSDFLQANLVLNSPDGTVLAFTSEATVQKDSLGYAKSVVVPGGSGMLVPPRFARRIDEEAVEVLFAMPAQLDFDDGDQLIKEGSSYVLRGDDYAVRFGFDPNPRDSGNRQAVSVPPGSKVTFLSGARALEITDPSEVSPCPQKFEADEETLLSLPYSAKIREEGGDVVATMQGCDSDSRVQVLSAEKPGIVLYESPASLKVEVPKGEVVDEEGYATVSAPAGSLITFTTCAKAPKDAKAVTIQLPEQAVIPIPKGAELKGEKLSLPALTNLELKYASGESFELSTTDELEFEPSDPNEFKADGQQAVLPPLSKISFVPYCDKAAKTTVIKANAGYLDVRLKEGANTEKDEGASINEGNPVVLELSNDDLLNGAPPFKLCLINNALRDIELLGVEVRADSAKQFNAEAERAFIPLDFGLNGNLYFDEATDGWTTQISTTPEQNACNSFTVQPALPNSLYSGVPPCIDSDFEGTARLVFKTRYEGEEGERVVPIKFKVDANSDECKSPEKTASSLDGVTVNHALGDALRRREDPEQLSFKGLGSSHYRYVSVNGFNEQPLFVYPEGTGLSCKRATANGETAFVPGLELAPGEGLLLKCFPTQAGSHSYSLDFRTQSGETAFTKKLLVVAYESDSPLYSSTPLGAVYCAEEETEEGGACAPLRVTSEEAQTSSLKRASFEGEPVFVPSPQSIQKCLTHYCTAKQFVDAFSSALYGSVELLESRVAGEALFDYYCSFEEQPLGGTLFLQATNFRADLDVSTQVRTVFEEFRSSSGLAKAGFSGEGELDGCGVYKLEVRPVLDCAKRGESIEDVKSNTEIQYSIVKAAGCGETLANSALLMPPDSTALYVGHEEPGGAFDAPPWQYGSFTSEKKEEDVETMKAIHSALYGYEDYFDNDLRRKKSAAAECWREYGETMAWAGPTLAGLCGGGLLANLIPGVGSVLGGRVAMAACTAAVAVPTCMVTATGANAFEGNQMCDSLNLCGYTAVMGVYESIISAATGGFGELGELGGRAGKTAGTNIGKTLLRAAGFEAVGTGVGIGVNEIFGGGGATTSYVIGRTAPLAYSGWQAVSTAGTSWARLQHAQKVVGARRQHSQEVVDRAKRIRKIQDEAAADGRVVGSGVPRGETPLDEVDNLQKTTAKNADEAVEAVQSSTQQATQKRKILETLKSRGAGFWGAIVASVGISQFLEVEFAPLEAVVYDYAPNYVVAAEESVYGLCYADDPQGECEHFEEIDYCEKELCVYLSKNKADQNGYLLYASASDEVTAKQKQELYSSLFNPYAPVLSAQELSALGDYDVKQVEEIGSEPAPLTSEEIDEGLKEAEQAVEEARQNLEEAEEEE